MANEGDKPLNRGAVEIAIIVFAAILVAISIYVGHTLVSDGSISSVQFSDIIRNYGLLALGMVGFPLAIWRSWIAYEQTQEAIEQGRRVERQIRATEDNNLAILIEKCAVLLADEKSAKNRAGIALARHIGLSPTNAFVTESLDMLREYLERKGKEPLTSKTDVVALSYACEIARTHEVIRIESYFSGVNITNISTDVRGVRFAKCKFTDSKITGISNYYFNCRFNNCEIISMFMASGEAIFENCKISSIVCKDAGNYTFRECDFSGAHLVSKVEKENMINCYYYHNNPPAKRVIEYYGDVLSVKVESEI